MTRAGVAVLIVTAGLASPAPPVAASPPVQEITEDTTWTKADSPVEIEYVHVVDGVTLTIEPGVRVESAHGALTVDGTLRAEGTESEPIVFTAAPDYGLWLGLGLWEQADSPSVVRHAVIEKATWGIRMAGPAVSIEDTTFTGNETAVEIFNSPAPAAFTGNRFYSNDVAFRARTSATITIRENDFWDNEVNLWFLAQSPFACGASPGVFEVHDNDILRGPDSEWFSFDVHTSRGSGDSGMVVDASDNWWGTTDGGDIQARLTRNFDCCPAPSRAPVRWRPPASSPRTAAEPPGPTGTPPPEPKGHGDPAYYIAVTSPGHRDCRAKPVRRVRGVAQGVFADAPKVLEVSFVRRVRPDICRSWEPKTRRFDRERTCSRRRSFDVAVRDEKWAIPFGRALRPGRYTVFAGSDPGTTIVSFRVVRARTTSTHGRRSSP